MGQSTADFRLFKLIVDSRAWTVFLIFIGVRNDFMNKYFTVNRYTNEYDNYNGLKFSGKISWRFLNKHSYLMNE